MQVCVVGRHCCANIGLQAHTAGICYEYYLTKYESAQVKRRQLNLEAGQ